MSTQTQDDADWAALSPAEQRAWLQAQRDSLRALQDDPVPANQVVRLLDRALAL